MSLTERTPLASIHINPLHLQTPAREGTSGLLSGTWQGRQAWWLDNDRHPQQALIQGGTLQLERADPSGYLDGSFISALQVELRGTLRLSQGQLLLEQTEHTTQLSRLAGILRRHLCESRLHIVLEQQGRMTYFSVDMPSHGKVNIRSGRGALEELAALDQHAAVHLIAGACPSQMKEVTELIRRNWKKDRNRAQRAGNRASQLQNRATRNAAQTDVQLPQFPTSPDKLGFSTSIRDA